MDIVYSVFFDFKMWAGRGAHGCIHYCGYIFGVLSRHSYLTERPAEKALEKYGQHVAWRFSLLVYKDDYSGDGFPYMPLRILAPFLLIPRMVSMLISYDFHRNLARRTWSVLLLKGEATNRACTDFVIFLHE